MAAAIRDVWVNSTPSASLSISINGAGILGSGGVQANDYLIYAVVSDSQFSSPTYPSGFGTPTTQANTADAQLLAIAQKLAAGSETALVVTSGTDTFIGMIIAVSGVDTTTPLDVAVVNTNSNTASASARTISGSITPATNGAMIVAITGTDTTASTNATTTDSTTSGTTGAWANNASADLNSGFRNIDGDWALQTTAGAVTIQSSSTFSTGNAGITQFLIAVRPAAGGDASAALTGVAGTGAVGNLGDAVAYGLTGVAGTSAVGSVKSAAAYAISGNAATGAVGTATSNVSYALTGNAATGAVGTLSTGSDASAALTGVAGTGEVGNVSPSITYALTGVQATGSPGTLVSSVAQGISGNAATAAVGDLGDAVSYTLTGVAGTGSVGTLGIGGDITIALSGVDATGQVGDLSILGATDGVVPAGGRRRRERYIARYKGEDIEFQTYEALEDFVVQAQKDEQKRPKQYRKPIKIRLTPEFAEEISPVVDIPAKITTLAPSAALAQVQRIERRLAEVATTDEEDDEVLLWLI